MTTVVGLDLSLTSTGLARITWVPEAVAVDTWRRGEAGVTAMSYPDKHRAIVHMAADILAFTEPADLVVVEEPVSDPRSTSTWERAALWWRVVGRLFDHEARVLVVAPSALKKWATGSGRAHKDDMVSAMSRMWPQVERVKNDTADALAAAGVGMHLLADGPLPFTPTTYRQQVLAGLTLPTEEAA